MIESIFIKGYRGIKELEIDKFKKYNFFVGDNSSCKTTLLEAINTSLPLEIKGLAISAYSRGNIFTKDDINNFFYNTEAENEIELILNNEVKTIIRNIDLFSNEQISKFQEIEKYNAIRKLGVEILNNVIK